MTSRYAVARLAEIYELEDGRCPYRPVRHHLGITAFGITAWTACEAGDRIVNEHAELEADSETQSADEELYLVLQGSAVFVLDGDRVDAPARTVDFAGPRVTRTALAEEPGTTVVAIGATPESRTRPAAGSSGLRSFPCTRRVSMPRSLTAFADRRGEAALRAAVLQPRLLREPHRQDGRRARPSSPRDRLSEEFRAYAGNDPDLDAIRAEPGFGELSRGLTPHGVCPPHRV